MPVDEHARAAIAGMPLSQQILIDGVELLGVGGTRRGRLSPNGFLSRVQQRILVLLDFPVAIYARLCLDSHKPP